MSTNLLKQDNKSVELLEFNSSADSLPKISPSKSTYLNSIQRQKKKSKSVEFMEFDLNMTSGNFQKRMIKAKKKRE